MRTAICSGYLRAAARSKLVVIMKSRRVPVSQEPEEAIAAGLTNSDIVCDPTY